MASQADVILETRSLVKAFHGFVAVDGVSLCVRRGQIHGLIGPNGAGKTTLFNLLTKFLQPSSGAILYRGENITRERPADVARRGIARSFQICAVFPHLTALENVRVALQRSLGTSFCFWRSEQTLAKLDARAMQLLAEVRLDMLARTPAGELSYGCKRALELATTLALEPELMLLDEPTQGMGHEDVARVTHLIKQVSANRTVLMVEHNMRVVSSIADAITVMQRGRVIASGSYADVSRNSQVIEAYMGTSSFERSGGS
ncbi:MAG: ABC transporter ATP-binding protein [Steroidobacteraceae bacterium]